jgi:hypothetical protein
MRRVLTACEAAAGRWVPMGEIMADEDRAGEAALNRAIRQLESQGRIEVRREPYWQRGVRLAGVRHPPGRPWRDPGGPAGQILDDVVERLRGFAGRVQTASDKEREWRQVYWLRRLAEIRALVEETSAAITGEELDQAMADILSRGEPAP